MAEISELEVAWSTKPGPKRFSSRPMRIHFAAINRLLHRLPSLTHSTIGPSRTSACPNYRTSNQQ